MLLFASFTKSLICYWAWLVLNNLAQVPVAMITDLMTCHSFSLLTVVLRCGSRCDLKIPQLKLWVLFELEHFCKSQGLGALSEILLVDCGKLSRIYQFYGWRSVCEYVATTPVTVLVFKWSYKAHNFWHFYTNRGTFRMERSDGFTFDCRIPPFTLESKSDDQSSPHGFFGWGNRRCNL